MLDYKTEIKDLLAFDHLRYLTVLKTALTNSKDLSSLPIDIRDLLAILSLSGYRHSEIPSTIWILLQSLMLALKPVEPNEIAAIFTELAHLCEQVSLFPPDQQQEENMSYDFLIEKINQKIEQYAELIFLTGLKLARWISPFIRKNINTTTFSAPAKEDLHCKTTQQGIGDGFKFQSKHHRK